MATLYELEGEYIQLLAMMEDDEMDPQAIADTLEGVAGEIEIKAEGYAKVIRMLEADADMFKTEKQRLEKKQKSIENNIKRMKEAIQNALVLTGHDDKEGMKAGLFTIKVVNNGGAQPLEITGDVPEEFQKVTIEADNEKIRKALSEGQEITFAQFLPRGRHLSIK